MQSTLQSPLEDPDILSLVLQQSNLTFDYDTLSKQPHRDSLRLLHSTATKLIDGFCTSYRDGRRSGEAILRIDPADVADRAAAAIGKLGPLRRVQLEGLDDDSLATVLAAVATGSGSRHRGLEVLWLQRGVFSGACLYTCHPKLAGYHIVGDGDELVPCLPVSPISVTCSPPSPRTGRLLPRLLELDLGGCGQLTDAGLEALTASAPLLARLRITVNALLRKPRLTCPWLRSATLAICANLQDEAVSTLCKSSPMLRELNLWRCSSLKAPAFRLPYLETLNLCECADLTDAATTSVASCTQVTSLMLAGCDGLAGTHRWGGGKALTTLDVSDMSATNDAQITAACADSPELRRLDFSRSGPGVQAPTVGGQKLQTIIATRCEHLVDDAVTGACDASPNLQTLMLALCTSLHSPRIHGERLAELNLSGCFALQDAAVTFVCENSPMLSRLSLSLCAALSAPSICGPNLRRLEMSHGEALSKPKIGGPSLSELSLSGCNNLEDEALESLCDNAPMLRKLSISGCAKLKAARFSSLSLQVLQCQGVARELVDFAADRLQCPALHKIVCEVYVQADGFEEVD